MNVLSPTRQNLEVVATYLRNGRHAILPTETVYGLAADASNESAVSEIFELKKRLLLTKRRAGRRTSGLADQLRADQPAEHHEHESVPAPTA